MDPKGITVLLALVFTGMPSVSEAKCSDPGSPFYMIKKSGTIKSPHYPTRYEAMESCDWFIEPPDKETDSIGIVKIVHVEMDNDGADLSQVCDNATDYVEIGVARACGKLDPICVAFLRTNSRIECHKKIEGLYPGCASIVHDAWPLDVRMRTHTGAMKPGFHLDYEFVDCKENYTPANIDVEKTTTASTAGTTTRSSPLQRPTKVNNVRTGGQNDDSPKMSTLLIVVVALVGVLFIIIVVLIAMRKRIRGWIKSVQSKQRIESPSPISEESVIPDKSDETAENRPGSASPTV